MGKTVLAIIVGGILVHAWGFVSWMMLPFHSESLNKFSNKEEVIKVLKEGATAGHGVYVIPDPDKLEDTQAGPFVFASIRPGSNENATMGKMVLRALTANLVSALLVGIMLSAAAPRLNYIGRVFFVVLAGLFAGISTAYPFCIWWEFPAKFVGLTLIDLVVGWGIAGLAMAGLIRGR